MPSCGRCGDNFPKKDLTASISPLVNLQFYCTDCYNSYVGDLDKESDNNLIPTYTTETINIKKPSICKHHKWVPRFKENILNNLSDYGVSDIKIRNSYLSTGKEVIPESINNSNNYSDWWSQLEMMLIEEIKQFKLNDVLFNYFSLIIKKSAPYMNSEFRKYINGNELDKAVDDFVKQEDFKEELISKLMNIMIKPYESNHPSSIKELDKKYDLDINWIKEINNYWKKEYENIEQEKLDNFNQWKSKCLEAWIEITNDCKKPDQIGKKCCNREYWSIFSKRCFSFLEEEVDSNLVQSVVAWIINNGPLPYRNIMGFLPKDESWKMPSFQINQ